MPMFPSDEDRLKVAIIGTSGSGKTCFIAAMRWLGECGATPRFISDGANGDSKNYLDDLHEAVNAGEVPPGTPKEFKLEFSQRYAFSEGKPPSRIDFSLRDFKGGDLPALDADSPLLQSWTQCELLMVLIDMENVQKQGAELQNNLRDLSSVLMRKEMDASQKRLAIVITQADKGGFSVDRHSPEEAERFLDENLPVFFERIKECCFKETKCFLLASIGLEPEKGADGKSRVPAVEGKREWRPFGYEVLFDWICAFQRQEKIARYWMALWTKIKPYIAVPAILVVGGVIWCGVVVNRQHNALLKYEGHSTLEEKAEATWEMRDEDCIKVIEERIDVYKSESEKTSDDASLRRLLADSKTFREKARISEEQEQRFCEIDSRIRNRLEEILFEKIKYAKEKGNGDSARLLIGQYLKDQVISRKLLEEVKAYDNELGASRRMKEKREIAYYDVGAAGNTARMNEKLIKIRDFNYPNGKEKEEARMAVGAMEKLMRGNFEITQINAEGLESSRNTYVLIATGVSAKKDLEEYRDEDGGVPVETKEVKSKDPQWDGDRMRHKGLSWTPGQSIRVEWRKNPWYWPENSIASLTVMDDWLGLLRILQPHVQMETEDDDLEPTITIKCKEFPDPANDLKLIERYVIPGTYWTEQ